MSPYRFLGGTLALSAPPGLGRVRAEWADLKQHLPKKAGRWAAGVVGTIVLSLVSAYVYDYLKSPSPDRRIVVIGVDRDRIWEDVKEGVEHYLAVHEKQLADSQLGVDIVNHNGDLRVAADTARALMADPTVLAIVLCGTSSQVADLLEHYRDDKPVLLARATNPDLPLRSNTFRLPPNDKKQVETLTQFLREKHREISLEKSGTILAATSSDVFLATDRNTRIAIFRDHTNEAYASYIADNVRKNLDHLIVSNRTEEERGSGIRVVLDGEIGGHDHGIHVTSDLADKIRPDLVFYAGNARSLLPLIHQGAQYGSWSPTIVLTEACIDSRFLNVTRRLFRNAYVTFPVFPEEERYSQSRPKSPSSWRDEPTYRPFGYDAIAILVEALHEIVGHSGDNGDYGAIKPRQLVSELKRIHFEGLAGNYGFKDGENTEAQYHVYRAVYDPSKRTWLWRHSSAECPVVIS